MNKERLSKLIGECPFCGGTAEICESTECAGHGDFYNEVYVVCTECYAKGPSVDDYMETPGRPMKHIAIDEWNKRKEKKDETVKEFWTSVKEALPAVNKRVLVVASTGGHKHVGTSTITSIRQDGKPKWCNYTTVTHWAPLPELPN